MNNLESRILALKAIAESTEAKDSDRVAAIRELNIIYGFHAPAKYEITINSVKLPIETVEG